MKDSLFVVVTKRGVERTCKTGNFSLKAGERAFRLDVEVPDEVFAPPLLPTVKLTIPREALSLEITASAEVDNADVEDGL